MAELHDLLEREAVQVTPSPEWAGRVREKVRRRERQRKITVIIVALALLVPPAVLVREAFTGDSGNAVSGPDAAKVAPSTMPPITGTTLSGATFGPNDYQGRTVVFATWASWCAPCRVQLRAVQAANDELQGSDVLFVGIDVRDTKDAALALDRELDISFDSVMDPSGSLVRQLGLIGVPSTLVLDQEGHVRFRFEGGPTRRAGLPGAESRLRKAVRAVSTSTGDALAQRLGLVKHPWPPGTRIDSGPSGVTASDGQDMSDCQPTGPGDVVLMQEVPDGAFSGFYCVHGASQIDAWVLAQKLAGHIPTSEEIVKRRHELLRR